MVRKATKKKYRQPTSKQIEAGELMKQGKDIATASKEAGYRTPSLFTGSDYFQDVILGGIDESKIIDNLEEIATQQDNMTAAINASKEILKLKNRFPEAKMTVRKYEATLKDLLEFGEDNQEE